MTDHKGAAGSGFTETELEVLHSLLSDELLYGDDEVVYMTTDYGKAQNQALSSISRKVENEAKSRGIWWAQ